MVNTLFKIDDFCYAYHLKSNFMKKLIISAVYLFSLSIAFAQEKQNYSHLNIGCGLGLDYGGFGARLTVLPAKQVNLFGSLGYNFDRLGYNAGVGFRFLPDNKFCPYFSAMYGYNAVVLTKDDKYTKTFYGPSAGVGFELRKSNESKDYFNLELLLPFRSKEFKDYKDELENNYHYKFISFPFAFSIGYHIGF
jgi:hypothetical protein